MADSIEIINNPAPTIELEAPAASSIIEIESTNVPGAKGEPGNANINSTPDNGVYPVLAGAVNDSNQLYTVAAGKYTTKRLSVYVNGLLETNFAETDPSTGKFTIGYPPEAGSTVTAIYSYR